MTESSGFITTSGIPSLQAGRIDDQQAVVVKNQLRQPSSSPKMKHKSSSSNASGGSSCRCSSLTRSSRSVAVLTASDSPEECENCANAKLSSGSSGGKGGAVRRRNPGPLKPYRKSHSAADLLEVGKAKSSLLLDNYNWIQEGGDLKSAISEIGVPNDIDQDGKYKKSSYKTRRFHRLFRSVPLTETLLSRFACAYVGDMGLLIQGHLYVSSGWFCFHSNIFGIEKIIEIPVSSIKEVTKERTAKIIPNAVGIRTKTGKRHLFGSLMSRDNTYHLLLSLMKKDRLVCTAGALEGEAYAENSLLESCEAGREEAGVEEEDLSCDDLSSLESTDLDDKKSTYLTDSGDSRERHWRESHRTSPSEYNVRSQARLSQYPSDIGWTFLVKSMLQQIVDWFFGLPKILMILSVCVILLIFLFLCAALLTFRLLYIRSNQAYHPPSNQLSFESMHRFSEKLKSNPFDRVHSALDSTLSLLTKVKKHLELLRKEVDPTADANSFRPDI